MPKAEIPVSSARISAIGTYVPTTWENVFYAVVNTFDPAHLQDVAALCADAIVALYNDAGIKPYLHNTFALQETRVVFRDSSSSVYRATLADVVVGTHAADGLPAQVAYLINWQTGDPRRGGKPRSYFAGVPDGVMLDSANILSTVRTSINTALVGWITANLTRAHGTASGIVFGEMSFRDAKAWRTTPVFYPFIAGTVSPVVATQRRRPDRVRP